MSVQAEYVYLKGGEEISRGTAKEVADYLGVQVGTLYNYASNKNIQHGEVISVDKKPRSSSPLVEADVPRIKRLMKENDYTGKDIAELMNIADETFYRRLRGHNLFRIEEVEFLEDLFFLEEGSLLKE